MGNIVSGAIGSIHLTVSVIALVTGLWVLCSTKGTQKHKQIGYLYAVSMVLLNVTAFMIYNLYGKFGIFHWLAIVSSLTLAAGMYPVITKKSKNYLLMHFSFMYWSVIGLYCAFVAEIFSRLPRILTTETGEPMTVFYKLVGLGSGLVMFIGIIFYARLKPKWSGQYRKA